MQSLILSTPKGVPDTSYCRSPVLKLHPPNTSLANDLSYFAKTKSLEYPLIPTSNHCCLYQFSSVTQLCPTLCNPMDCSMPGFPVHHQLLELTQAHVHKVSNAIQPSHPLLSPYPPAFNISQHQGLFQ